MGWFGGLTTSLAEVPGLLAGFAVIWDTGCSFTVTPHRSDFESYTPLDNKANMLKGVAKGLEIAGRGIVVYCLVDDDGNELQMRLPALHVPKAPRLLSPQSYLQLKSLEESGDTINVEEFFARSHDPTHADWTSQEAASGDNDDETRVSEFVVRTGWSGLCVNGQIVKRMRFLDASNLPTCEMYCPRPEQESDRSAQADGASAYHTCVTNLDNSNLSTAQKHLVQWHYRLGH